jgi:5-methyltetrahydrofolate--homocysteine methyltransferase
VRRDYWGYENDAVAENGDASLNINALIREEYRGIRPAPGYPACPEHSVKAPLFALLDAPAIGMTVTESFAMLPAAAVSGFYLAHPDATYFAVGKIGEDQAADFTRRSGWTAAEGARWLAPNLR